MNILNTTIKDIYTYLKYIFYILLIITIFTTNQYAPQYLDEINIIIKLFICLFLIYRFNPLFGTNNFDEFDKSVVFDSAFYLLSTTLLINFLEIFKKRLKIIIQYYQNYDKNKHKNKINKK